MMTTVETLYLPDVASQESLEVGPPPGQEDEPVQHLRYKSLTSTL